MISRSEAETFERARRFLAALKPGTGRATVVGLQGELGSGKTVFVRAAARTLGVQGRVTSPTFVLQKIYTLKNRVFKKLIHLDCYRIQKSQEILALGWQNLLADPGNLVFVEWPERIQEILPQRHHRIFFKFISETERDIKLNHLSLVS